MSSKIPLYAIVIDPGEPSKRVSFVGDVHLLETPPKSRKDDYLSSIMEKVSWVSKRSDIIIFLGDIFERSAMSISAFHKVLFMFFMLKLQGKEFYTVIGNHDVPHQNITNLPRTSLGVLNTLRLVNILGSMRIGGVRIDTIPFGPKVEVPRLDRYDENAILIGHCFYESRLDPKYSMTEEDASSCGYNFILLGHDHEPHTPMSITTTLPCDGLPEKTHVYRPGSLARNTAHRYNQGRTPDIVQFMIGNGGIESFQVIPVPCAPYADVFYDTSFAVEESSSSVTDLEALMTSFDAVASGDDTINVRWALRKLNAPGPVMNYLESVYEKLGMVF